MDPRLLPASKSGPLPASGEQGILKEIMPENEQSEFFPPAAEAKIPSGPPPQSTELHVSRERSVHQPLAARMRPRSLNEIAGQEHLLGEDCLLPRLVRNDTFGSLIFFGPPGTGKTSIAHAIAEEVEARFEPINAVTSNTAEIRERLKLARYRQPEQTILFIDEIHRFNRAQQDLLLPDVESGTIRLIGATTHNPGFYVNPPLLSRSHLFKLEPVSNAAAIQVLRHALEDAERGLGARGVTAAESVLAAIARMSDGDLRRALNALETLVLSCGMGEPLSEAAVQAFASERQIRYDASEDEHYDTISAFIKSMRGSDADAALYWLAKMLKGGEDPRFIARRLVIFASEDVGLANAQALPLATSCVQACEFVGLPECELNLAHTTAYLARSAKSNATTVAIARAKKSIADKGLQPVPLWLRDSHTKFNKSQGQGEGYVYSHDDPENKAGQTYMEQPERFLPEA
jgi:putative ATPase